MTVVLNELLYKRNRPAVMRGPCLIETGFYAGAVRRSSVKYKANFRKNVILQYLDICGNILPHA
jgi:hypothetical protein